MKADGVSAYRVLTTLQRFTPNAEVFESFAGKQLTVEVFSASVLCNEIQVGPFKAPIRTIKVVP